MFEVKSVIVRYIRVNICRICGKIMGFDLNIGDLYYRFNSYILGVIGLLNRMRYLRK